MGRTVKPRLAPPLKDDVQMGPLVSRDHAANVVKAIEEGVAKGSKVLAGGGRADSPDLRDGNFVRPTVFEDPPPGTRVAREEVFGPVVAAWHFSDLDEAIRNANDTPYGLAAGVWTQDGPKAHTVACRRKGGRGAHYEGPGTAPPAPLSRL